MPRTFVPLASAIPSHLKYLAVSLSLFCWAAAPIWSASLSGRVLDVSGAPIEGAVVAVVGDLMGSVVAETGAGGSFLLSGLVPGTLDVSVLAPGYVELIHRLTVSEPGSSSDFVLSPASLSYEVTVVGQRIVSSVEQARRVPGSYDSISSGELETSRPFTTHEVLRKIPGLHARDEEGLGLRPNIGIRGLNPTRSTKVLFLEDGVPLSYAPYGDNASYYHPPVERFSSIEVLKGSSQILYGPQTMGGVINYLTATPPREFTASLSAAAGNRAYRSAHASAGGTLGGVGVVFDYLRKEGDGARDNTGSRLDDVGFKAVRPLGASQALTLKGTHYAERSQLTYSGLTQSEYEVDPRQNPFRHDATDFSNLAGSLSHDAVLSPRAHLSSVLYASRFSRDWWRQSSNSTQRPNDRSDPACGGMANLSTTCGNEGRLRDFETWGITPRLSLEHGLFGAPSELHAGVRWHQERQERLQKNGPLPQSRDGVLVEDNRRDTDAFSAYVDHRFARGRWAFTPGVRFESISYGRINRLGNGGAGASGETSISQFIPGVALSYQLADRATLFAGMHRGFGPPRAEDIISNSGGVVELDAELSWNAELGVRAAPRAGLSWSATAFRMDYENQVVPASLAGGLGATLTNGGETLHQGVEGSFLIETAPLLRSAHDVTLRVALTWLETAEFRGNRRSSVAGSGTVSVSGNRLPYAPETLWTAALGYRHPRGAAAMLEGVFTGAQFGDDLNSVAPSLDGQRGSIPAYWQWNAMVEQEIPQWRATMFVTVKNLLDETAIVDRSRGVIPSIPRMVQAGFKVRM